MANGNAQPRPQMMKQESLKVESFSVMQGMNTQEERSGIQPGFWSWLMNVQPIGKRTLRFLNGKGSDIYTLAGDTIVCGYSYVIGTTNYAILFTSAGAAYQVNLATGSHTTVGTSSTFWNGSGQYPQAVPFGNSGILIISPLGYWAWDGTTLFAAGSEAPLWLSGLSAAFTPTGTVSTSASTCTSMSSTTGLVVGMADFSGNYPAGTTIVSVDSSSQVTMSAHGTVNGSETLKFDWPMPSGIVGTSIEIYNASPWIVNGRTILASAPGNGATFATSLGGVSLSVKDSYVQGGYFGLKQLDGFLYLFAAGAVDVISDVQTSGSPPSTTFLRVNVSPIVGSPWRDSISALPSSIAFANPTGVYEVSGGQARKVSDMFDGVFEEANYPAASADPSGYHPSASILTLNETTCYALTIILPDPDDATNTFVPDLAIWDGRRWFLGSQESNPVVVLNQNNNSVLKGWASTGTDLFQMFKTPSSTLTKKAKSWFSVGDAGITMRKHVKRIYTQFGNTTSGTPLTEFNIDTESGTVTTAPIPAPQITWVNNSGGVIQFQNNSAQNIFWVTIYPLVSGGFANAICLMFGVTVTSNLSSLDIIGLFVGYTDYSRYQ